MSLIVRSTPSAPVTISLAGALCTPRLLSLRAMIPQTWPDGGTRIGALERRGRRAATGSRGPVTARGVDRQALLLDAAGSE